MKATIEDQQDRRRRGRMRISLLYCDKCGRLRLCKLSKNLLFWVDKKGHKIKKKVSRSSYMGVA